MGHENLGGGGGGAEGDGAAVFTWEKGRKLIKLLQYQNLDAWKCMLI